MAGGPKHTHLKLAGPSAMGMNMAKTRHGTLLKPSGFTICWSGRWFQHFTTTARVARMRESMARLTPRFSANRTVHEYTEKYYLPAFEFYEQRSADKGALGRQIIDWRHGLQQKWGGLRFGQVNVQTAGNKHNFEVQVFLDQINPDAVRVELYADGVGNNTPVYEPMTRAKQLAGSVN